MDKRNSVLRSRFQAYIHSAKDSHINSLQTWSKNVYIQARVSGQNNHAMTLKEMSRLKSKCSADSSKYALLMVQYLPSRLWDITMSVHDIHANPWTCGTFVPMPEIFGTNETNNAVYAIYEITNRQSYCGETWNV